MRPLNPLKFASLSAALVLLPLSFPAQADYRYEYTSNPLPVTWTAIFDPELPPSIIDTTLTAVILSPTPLTGGSGLTSGLSFTLTQSAPLFFTETLPYPYPYPPLVDGCGPGTPCHPFDEAIFSIGAVDASGLPTQWNIGINFSYWAPTGREYFRSFLTSTDLDSISGGYEGFTSLDGSLLNNPGTWTVAVVPEPGVSIMLLAGVGLLGFVAHRKQMA